MAAVFVLLMGAGGWLMYEAYKGKSISDIKSTLQGTTETAATGRAPTTTTAAANPELNTLDTGTLE